MPTYLLLYYNNLSNFHPMIELYFLKDEIDTNCLLFRAFFLLTTCTLLCTPLMAGRSGLRSLFLACRLALPSRYRFCSALVSRFCCSQAPLNDWSNLGTHSDCLRRYVSILRLQQYRKTFVTIQNTQRLNSWNLDAIIQHFKTNPK